ncbi:MAG: PAS domain S-box protein [Propylenella sp.]
MVAVFDKGGGMRPAVEPPARDPLCADDRLLQLVSAPDRRSLELLQALPAAIYLTDAEGRITFYNTAAAELWGVRPELGKSEWCGSWRLYWPDGRPMPHDECPMAVALKEGRAFRGAEAVAERPDGTRVPFLAYPTPFRDESGAVTGAINMLVDVSNHKRAEIDKQLLAAIVESSDDAIASKDLNGVITSWNAGAERLFGYSAAEAIGQPVMMLIPPDRRDEEARILERIRRGERVERYETVRERRDGSRVDVALTVSPIRDAGGKVVGASKIARDITERRRADEQRRLVLREMGHRVKNLFALASSIVGQSARSAETSDDLAASVRERLAALAQAHDLTVPRYSVTGVEVKRSVQLDQLVCAMLSPYAGGGGEAPDRVTAAGPELTIGGDSVTSFALLLHEFATNAAKHGALSTPSGRVAVTWEIEADELRLAWRESGGPPIHDVPRFEGFGSALAKNTVRSQFRGELHREWRREGLLIHIFVPTDALRNGD